MEKERLERYREKINLAKKRLSQSEEWLMYRDEKTKLACYKSFQEAIEAITDIIAMILANKNKIVRDDYSNIEETKEIFDLDKKEIEVLKEANGLRNRIIHKYNNIDEEIIKESIKRILHPLNQILNKLEKKND